MQHPDAVVVLDEFEKAHPNAIADIFLAAFDEDGFLKVINCMPHAFSLLSCVCLRSMCMRIGVF